MTAAGDVVIAGVAMTTAIGLTAAETAASVRAGTTRFGETRLYDRSYDPFVLATVPTDGLPALTEELNTSTLTAREARLLRLAAGSLVAVRAGLAPDVVPSLLVALPETPTTRPLVGKAFLAWLSRQVPGAFDVPGSDARYVGRGGGLLVVAQAVEAIRSGAASFVIAGGVDTYFDPFVLSKLDVDQRVKSATNLDGFIPGEGAGFVLVASRAAAESRGLAPMASIGGVGYAAEPGHLYSTEPYQGPGLAAALQMALATPPATPIADVYASMNGESHWAKEWGVALARNGDAVAGGHRIHHPAEYFGDLGAACGPVMIGLATLGVRGGYRTAPCLVYASSDREARAAVVLDVPPI